MDSGFFWLIAVLVLIGAVGIVFYSFRKRKKQHWQVGYLTLRTSKPGKAPEYHSEPSEPIWGQSQQTQSPNQQNQGGDVQLPPGMF